MKYLYTWKDVEIKIQSSQKKWPKSWKKVDVYCDEILIFKNNISMDNTEDRIFLRELLETYYSAEENAVCIKEFDVKLPISYEIVEDADEYESGKDTFPLFKSVYYSEEITPSDKMHTLPGKPLIAFHSYKGGVGRTLSLIAVLKEISSIYGNQKRVLIIDSDLEAPGLTWAIEKSTQFSFSYIDFLSVIRVYGEDDKNIEKAAELAMENTIYVETEKERVQHYFLPAYSEESQLSTVYSRPESFLEMVDNKFLISEAVSRLGRFMDVDLVLVDLRAGISEISAPFLFDPRVDKYFVSSTSLQSIEGTRRIQEQVYKKSKLSLMNSKILMTMIPNELPQEVEQNVIDRLVEIPESHYDDKEDATFLRDEYVVRGDFDTKLLHQGNFEEICNALTGTNVSRTMNGVAKRIFSVKERKTGEEAKRKLDEQTIRECLKKLNSKAEETAEAGNGSDMLLTDSIKEIIKRGRKELPNLVVLGAKGAGKTYLYKQLVYKQTWKEFVDIFENKEQKKQLDSDAVLIPVLSTANYDKWKDAIEACLVNADNYFGGELIDRNVFRNIQEKVKQALEEGRTSLEWKEIWIKQFLSLFSGKFENLEELNRYLLTKNKRIIFLIDGLDDLMNCVYEQQENARKAVQVLCQDVMKDLSWIENRAIGMIVFLRKDIAEDSIKINYQQFRDQYSKYELNWSQNEALRLALWIAGKAIPELMLKENENILLLSKDEIEKRLELLWGKKLGKQDSKEAFSSRWILAALSDFNGQLQARDIVRFIKHASEQPSSIDYYDRYFMPGMIRVAIEPCAKKKLDEIKVEMRKIYDILKKFDEKDADDKLLPLEQDRISLSVEELEKLEQHGFIKLSEKKYYLPEIIRLALGFKYRRGARPKVLSMIIQ